MKLWIFFFLLYGSMVYGMEDHVITLASEVTHIDQEEYYERAITLYLKDSSPKLRKKLTPYLREHIVSSQADIKELLEDLESHGSDSSEEQVVDVKELLRKLVEKSLEEAFESREKLLLDYATQVADKEQRLKKESRTKNIAILTNFGTILGAIGAVLITKLL